MLTREDLVLLIGGSLLSLVAIALIQGRPFQPPSVVHPDTPTPMLLTDPFLQAPTDTSVQVVWFTEFAGISHTLAYGPPDQTDAPPALTKFVKAKTIQLSRMREDHESRVKGQTEQNPLYLGPQPRLIWRHEAKVSDLKPNRRFPYRVTSIREDGEVFTSDIFSLGAKPTAQKPLKILLTSDHQLMPMVPANLQKVEETVGQVDAVFLAGDLVNIPDRASEWFDDDRGNAFFPSLQGRARHETETAIGTVTYRGGQLIQNAPLFPAIGNHEVMGRFSLGDRLKDQFNHPVPRAVAAQQYERYAPLVNPQGDEQVQQQWIENQSFNIDTVKELFTLPGSLGTNALSNLVSRLLRPWSSQPSLPYYAITFGDIRLVSLYVTQIWRTPDLTGRRTGRYLEAEDTLFNPDQWGYGQHIFEPIELGSPQFTWLQQELASPEFQQARYKIVMFHHPPHTLGDNIVPAFTNPVQVMDRDAEGKLQAVRYEYPKSDDYIVRDLLPLLEKAGVQLVFYGHSHLWNRFRSDSGTHFLESSNVGNTYGAATADNPRSVPPPAADQQAAGEETAGKTAVGEMVEGDGSAAKEPSAKAVYKEDYVAIGDPNGLDPIVPTLAPLKAEDGSAMPYIASNDITVFSIFETETGTVSSYYFDTCQPDSTVVKFDAFVLGDRTQ